MCGWIELLFDMLLQSLLIIKILSVCIEKALLVCMYVCISLAVVSPLGLEDSHDQIRN